MFAARGRRALLPMLALSWLLILAACGSGSSSAPPPNGDGPPADCARAEGGVIELAADNLEFDAPCLVAPAGEPFTIRFSNLESLVHNVAVYDDPTRANQHFRGDFVSGPDRTIEYAVDALSAGEYYFDCTVHPAMNGTLYVT